MSTSPHRVSRLTFLIYSLDLLYKVTHIFWALTCKVALPSCTALVSSFCSSSHEFDTHFLHFHLTMDSLCFSIWLAICTSNTDFHRLAKQHACRTIKTTYKLYKFVSCYKLEQVVGIEPTSSAWKAEVLPLNYTCIINNWIFLL